MLTTFEQFQTVIVIDYLCASILIILISIVLQVLTIYSCKIILYSPYASFTAASTEIYKYIVSIHCALLHILTILLYIYNFCNKKRVSSRVCCHKNCCYVIFAAPPKTWQLSLWKLLKSLLQQTYTNPDVF